MGMSVTRMDISVCMIMSYECTHVAPHVARTANTPSMPATWTPYVVKHPCSVRSPEGLQADAARRYKPRFGAHEACICLPAAEAHRTLCRRPCEVGARAISWFYWACVACTTLITAGTTSLSKSKVWRSRWCCTRF